MTTREVIHGIDLVRDPNTSSPTPSDVGSDAEEDYPGWAAVIPMRGVLSKWTNLLHGWQERYFTLIDGVLTYYRNLDEVDLGSRGSIRVRMALIKANEFDECRFEINAGDCIWYLRGQTPVERHQWMSSLECHRVAAESGYASERTLHRPSSQLSLNSTTQSPGSIASSSTSAAAFRVTTCVGRMRDKVAEMEAFKELLSRQVDSLQSYFDLIVANTSSSSQVTSSSQNDSPSSTVAELAGDDACQDSSTEAKNESSSLVGSFMPGLFGKLLLPFRSSASSTRQLTARPSDRQSIDQPIDRSPRPGQCNETSSLSNYEDDDQQRAVALFSTPTLSSRQLAVHFRNEGHMFKASEDQWQRRVNREIEKRRRVEEANKTLSHELANVNHQLSQQSRELTHFRLTGSNAHSPSTAAGGPDCLVESPYYNSMISEEEFFDAIDAESDRLEQIEVGLAALKLVGEQLRSARAMPSSHRLFAEIDASVRSRVESILASNLFDRSRCSGNGRGEIVDQSGLVWQIITQEGDMAIYKREQETADGVVLDPTQYVGRTERRLKDRVEEHLPKTLTSVLLDNFSSSITEHLIDIVHFCQRNEAFEILRKAVHVIPGVTAKEVCNYFWDVQFRTEWEFTIESAPFVVEVCGDDTVVIHQLFKKVWPTTQRDALFWSHMRQVNTRFPSNNQGQHHRSQSVGGSQAWLSRGGQQQEPTSANRDFCCDAGSTRPGHHHPSTNTSPQPEDLVLDSWLVVNRSTDYAADRVKLSSSPSAIRIDLDVVLYCQTYLVAKPASPSVSPPLSRSHLATRLVYTANVNPGGWVPAAGLRALARREYPRFLKKFSAYVIDKTANTDPMF